MMQDEQFDYFRDIVKEMMQNQDHLLKLFNHKYPNQILRQQKLKLNSHLDSDFKKKVLAYLKQPKVLESLKQEILNDPKIGWFMKIWSHKTPGDAVETHFGQMMQKVQEKAQNNKEPLTFYNNNVQLFKEIQGCFQLRKEFENQYLPLHYYKFEEIYDYQHFCRYCNKALKNNAGLGGHQKNHCPLRPEVMQLNQRKGHVSDRLRNQTKKIYKVPKQVEIQSEDD